MVCHVELKGYEFTCNALMPGVVRQRKNESQFEICVGNEAHLRVRLLKFIR